MRITFALIASAVVAGPAGAEVFVDIGANNSEIVSHIGAAATVSDRDGGLHLGVGVRRAFGERHDIGARLEWDDIGDTSMLAIRAVDYRWHFGSRFALGGFLGAARLDLATAAFGYYAGIGLDWKTPLPKWDLRIDARYGDKVARDNLLPDDPTETPDNFHDVRSVSLFLSRRF